MPVALAGFSAVSARDFVWVFGGAAPGGLSDSLYRYDVLTGSWEHVATYGQGPAPRRHHRAVACGGSMLVLGGLDGSFFPETMDDVWQLDLRTLSWTEKAALPDGLAAMVAQTIPAEVRPSWTGQVLLYGGVVDAWSFPYDLSDSTLVYTADAAALSSEVAFRGDVE
jgi:hypothetical protein